MLQTNVLRQVTSDLDLPLNVDPALIQLVKTLDIDLSRAEGDQTRKTVMYGGKRRTRKSPKRIGRGAPCHLCWPKCKCLRKRGCDCGSTCGCKRCRVGCGCKRCRVGKPLRVGCRGRTQRGGAAPGPLRSFWWDLWDTVDKVGSAALGSPLAGRVRGVPKFIGKQVELLPTWLPGA